jgi:single-strand DNA-binding protein
MSLNTVSLAGRLVRDPEIVENKKGKTVLFTVAVERNYKDSEGNRPVDFVPVKAFVREDAKNNGPFDYMVKGQLVAIQAELRATQYQKDGETVYGLDVVVSNNGMTLLDRPASAKAAK